MLSAVSSTDEIVNLPYCESLFTSSILSQNIACIASRIATLMPPYLLTPPVSLFGKLLNEWAVVVRGFGGELPGASLIRILFCKE